VNVFVQTLTRILIVTVALGGAGLAQNLHVGVRTGGAVSFPGVTAFLLGVQLEARALIGDEFGVRLDLGLNSGIGFLAVTRPIPDAFGPLYLGLGVGYAFDPVSKALDGRVLVGYEWLLTPELRVLVEGLVRVPFDGSGPRLEVSVGLNLQLTGVPPPVPTPDPNAPNTNPNQPGPNQPGPNQPGPNQPSPTPPQG
jgi:hypothetical protein